MSKKGKIISAVILLIITCFSLFIYFSFAGTPWSKIYYRYQLKDYLTNKYGEEMIITQAYYNFKDGKYGVRAHPKNNTELEFSAWQHYDKSKKYRDYYPEALWNYQANTEFEVILDEIYPDAVRTRLNVVIGFSENLNINNGIPHYLEVEHLFSLIVNINGRLTEDKIDNEVDKLAALIEEIKRKGASISILIVYTDENDDSKNRNKYINIEFKEQSNYPSKEELKEKFILAILEE